MAVTNLYFGNLPTFVRESDLASLVRAHATVLAARVALDPTTGRSRGFGYVEVPAGQADMVIERLNDSCWQGRQLVVNEARPRPPRRRPHVRGES